MTNARKVKVTGNKAQQLVYRHHTMYPGGLKEIQYKDMMAKKPDEVCLTPVSGPLATHLVYCPDHSSSGVRHVTKKQAPRAETSKTAYF